MYAGLVLVAQLVDHQAPQVNVAEYGVSLLCHGRYGIDLADLCVAPLEQVMPLGSEKHSLALQNGCMNLHPSSETSG